VRGLRFRVPIPALPFETGKAVVDKERTVRGVGKLFRAHTQINGIRNEKVSFFDKTATNSHLSKQIISHFMNQLELQGQVFQIYFYKLSFKYTTTRS